MMDTVFNPNKGERPMDEFKKTKEFKTVFGTVITKYIAEYTEPAHILNGMKERIHESHYEATITDGEWNGWRGTGVNRDNAAADLLKQVAERYAHDLVDIV